MVRVIPWYIVCLLLLAETLEKGGFGEPFDEMAAKAVSQDWRSAEELSVSGL